MLHGKVAFKKVAPYTYKDETDLSDCFSQWKEIISELSFLFSWACFSYFCVRKHKDEGKKLLTRKNLALKHNYLMKIQAEINFQNRNYLIVRVRAGVYECIGGMSNEY